MFLGLDLGTSGIKALLMRDDQTVLGSTQAPLSVSRPAAGWSEQNPLDWIAAAETALTALGTSHDLSAVEGIGLSGQMHGATLLDASGAVLRPCILWNDTRSHKEAAALDAMPLFREQTGNIVFPGFTAPKLSWVQSHEPDNFSKTSKILLPKDYLRLWLTGEHVSEMSDAAGTSWLNPASRDWSDDLLAATDLGRDHMPGLVEGCDVSGYLRSGLASQLGLPAGIPVAGGAGDNAASAIGVGVIKPGDGFISLGTSGVLFSASDSFSPDPDTALHTFCHAMPDRWHQMGVILAATDSLAWLANLLESTSADLTMALGPLKAPGRTMFLPYLGGERTPHNDARIRGSFVGLEHATDREAAARAVLEGVAFAFRDSNEAMQQTGTTLDRVIAVGGGSRSDYWLQTIATALNLPVAVPKDGDFGAAFGAARLGRIASGQGGVEDLAPPAIEHIITPDETLAGAFDDAYARYRALYDAVKDLS